MENVMKDNMAKARKSDESTFTAGDIQGDTIEDRVEFAHVLYMSNLLSLQQYLLVLKKEKGISNQRTHKAFSNQVFQDWHWLKIFKFVEHRWNELLNVDDLAVKIDK
jgi:hypothetical protein